MHPVLFRIPGLDWPLHSYGVLIVTGFLVAMFLGWHEARRQEMVLPEDQGIADDVLDFAFWALVGGMLGARIVFIIVNWKDYSKNPIQILQVWKGGLVFYGAALGGFFAFVAFARSRKWSLLRSLKLADIIVVSMPLAHIFGRFGCVAAGCCWGQSAGHLDGTQVIQDIPIAARFPEGALAYNSLIRTVPSEVADVMRDTAMTLPLFPSQLAEAFGESIIYMILLVVRSRKWFHGQALLSYFILYPILRFTLEFFRGDKERGVYMLGLSTSQLISIGVAAASLTAIFVLRQRGLAKLSSDIPDSATVS